MPNRSPIRLPVQTIYGNRQRNIGLTEKGWKRICTNVFETKLKDLDEPRITSPTPMKSLKWQCRFLGAFPDPEPLKMVTLEVARKFTQINTIYTKYAISTQCSNGNQQKGVEALQQQSQYNEPQALSQQQISNYKFISPITKHNVQSTYTSTMCTTFAAATVYSIVLVQNITCWLPPPKVVEEIMQRAWNGATSNEGHLNHLEHPNHYRASIKPINQLNHFEFSLTGRLKKKN